MGEKLVSIKVRAKNVGVFFCSQKVESPIVVDVVAATGLLLVFIISGIEILVSIEAGYD